MHARSCFAIAALGLAFLCTSCSDENGGSPSAAVASAGPAGTARSPSPDAPAAAADPEPVPPAPESPAPPPDPVLVEAAARAASAGTASPVACRYRVEGEENGQRRTWEWYVRRDADVVSTRETATETGESWYRGAAGEVESFEYVFFRDRTVLEYRLGDLRALGAARSWSTVESLVNREALEAGLRPLGPVKVLGQEGVRRFGASGGGTVLLVWLPSLSLPAEIDRRTPTSRTRFILEEVHPLGEEPWKEPATNAFRRVDFADLGDHPTDPFLRRIAAGGGAYPGSSTLHANCGPTCAPGLVRSGPGR